MTHRGDSEIASWDVAEEAQAWDARPLLTTNGILHGVAGTKSAR